MVVQGAVVLVVVLGLPLLPAVSDASSREIDEPHPNPTAAETSDNETKRCIEETMGFMTG